jgi:uncharacterized protein
MNAPTRDLPASLRPSVEAILDELASLPSIVVAFSGGVDSSVVAALAYRALGDAALAATAVSETLATHELDEARAIASEIGIPHELVAFSELDSADFRANTSARCFFCQSMRFDQMRALADKLGFDAVASGSNASDVGDHRPGLEAMAQRRVLQPLLTHGVSKAEVREIARWLGLSVWDKPAKACLSSRIPHGLEVTEARLRRVEAAENVLLALGFRQFRVRDHGGHARVEIATDELPGALSPDTLSTIADGTLDAGFSTVSLDLVGYRSGSLNPVRRG